VDLALGLPEFQPDAAAPSCEEMSVSDFYDLVPSHPPPADRDPVFVENDTREPRNGPTA